MQYFRPKFKIATLCPPQDRLVSKVGGLPWGLPAELWPRCCGVPQKLMAQLCHEPPMLDLGAEGSVLHLFMCPECGGICDDTGLAAFVVDRSVLGGSLARVEGWDVETACHPALTGEAWIVGWEERNDGIPAERLPEFFEETKLRKLKNEFPAIEWFDSLEGTKFGGSPRWTGHGPMGFPPPPFEFLFQLESYLFVEGPPPKADDAGCLVETYTSGVGDRVEERPDSSRMRLNAPWYILYERGATKHYFGYTNLGSDGTAFTFIDRTERPHRVRWFWNR